MSFSNSDDTIDSRDVIARIEELREELDSLIEAVDTADGEFDRAYAAADLVEWLGCDKSDETRSAVLAAVDASASLKDWATADDAKELFALEALADEAAGYAADWEYGETLIRESYFVDYCKELVKDTDGLPRDLPDYLVIDWKATAENLKVDYTEVEFDGVTYLIR